MNRHKLTKKQLIDKQIEEDRKFKKITIKIIIISILFIILLNVFYIHWCDTRLVYREFVLYGKIVPPELCCFAENRLKQHNTSKLVFNTNIFYVCSSRCKHFIEKHFKETGFVTDALTGDTISKSNTVIGLLKRGNSELIYFKNKHNFDLYYEQKK